MSSIVCPEEAQVTGCEGERKKEKKTKKEVKES